MHCQRYVDAVVSLIVVAMLTCRSSTGMHAEQYKLLDTLILLEARGVVTHYKSLGGLFLNEYRHLVFKGNRSMTRVQTQVWVVMCDAMHCAAVSWTSSQACPQHKLVCVMLTKKKTQQIIVDRLPREFDRLIGGGLFTTRHSKAVQDLPMLFIGDGQSKMDALLKKQVWHMWSPQPLHHVLPHHSVRHGWQS